MKANHFIHTLSAMLAGLMLVGCASQTADQPLPTIGKTDTSSVTTSSVITTEGSSPVTAAEPGTTDTPASTVIPGTTQGTPTTVPASSESESQAPVATSGADLPSETTPRTTERAPVTDPPVSSQTPSPETSSQTPVTSKTPTTSAETTTTTKKATSQTPTTAETPVPTPHTHSWSDWKVTKAATCTANGESQRSCSGCGEVEKELIYPNGHSWNGWVVTKEPTVEEEGVETTTCVKCGAKETRSIDRLPQPEVELDPEWLVERFLQRLNEERAAAGVQTLVTDAKMHEMAQVRADELTVIFEHFRPDGSPWSTIFDDFEYGIYYDFTDIGMDASYNYYSPFRGDEDIGHVGFSYDFMTMETMEWCVNLMMSGFKNSTGHWRSLMNDEFSAVGVAVAFREVSPGYCDVYFEVLLTDKLY